MTVPAGQAPLITYAYLGPNDYDFPFRVLDSGDLEVAILDVYGERTVLAQGEALDYTVTLLGDGDAGGTVTVLSEPSGGTLEIRRDTVVEQPTDWVNNSSFNTELLEIDLDRAILIIQELRSVISSNYVRAAWRGTWLGYTEYAVSDLVQGEDSNWYVALSNHTSSDSFEDDLALGYWLLAFDVGYVEDLASQAAQSEANASDSATNAASSEAAAKSSEDNAASSESNASLSENNAANCAAESTASASSAAESAAEAASLIIVGERSDAISTDFYTASAGQTDFSITKPTAEDNIFVFMNSRKLRLDEDYTLNSEVAASVLTLISPADVGDEIDITSINTYDISGIHDDIAAALVDAEGSAAESAASAAESAASAAESAASASESLSSAAESAASAAESAASAAESAASASESLSSAADSLSSAGDSSTSAAESAASAADSLQSALDAEASAADINIAEIAETLVTAATVDTFIYDTTKDSDGGAWRDRCQDLSWYNETLNTATRGKTRKFPAVAAIVAETNKVTIFDLTDPAAPMWMVFNVRFASLFTDTYMIVATANGVTTISALNGVLSVGTTTIGLNIINFITDNGHLIRSTEYTRYDLQISGRNTVGGGRTQINTTFVIVNNIANDVSMTILDNAPIDSETGIAVPTIAVATDGGVSVIDGPAGVGTVVDITWDQSKSHHITFDNANNIRVAHGNDAGTSINMCHVYAIPTSDITETYYYAKGNSLAFYTNYEILSNTPDLFFIGGDTGSADTLLSSVSNDKSMGHTKGLTLLKENPTTPAEGSVAYITDEYNTGWMKGDIRLATLADTVAGGIGTDVTTELVENGTFDTDTTGWTAASATLTVDTQRLKVTNYGAFYGAGYQAIATVIGQVYTVSLDYELGTLTEAGLRVRDTATGGSFLTSVAGTDPSGTLTATFKATTTACSVWCSNGQLTDGGHNFYDNITVKAVQNLVENGEFSSDRAWNTSGSGSPGWVIASGVASLDGTQTGGNCYLRQSCNIEVGTKYRVTFTISNYVAGTVRVLVGASADDVGIGTPRTADGTYTEVLEGGGNGILFYIQGYEDFNGDIDNVVVESIDVADRCVKDNDLQVVGELTKAPVATGAELVAYSGFSTDNYIEQPYTADLDFGTGDFCVMGWLQLSSLPPATREILHRADVTVSGAEMRFSVRNTGALAYYNGTSNFVSTSLASTNSTIFAAVKRESGVTSIFFNGVNEYSAADTVNLDNASALLFLGVFATKATALETGSIALWRLTATAPTDQEILDIYNEEKKLFEEGAKCTLPSSNVLALDYNEYTDSTLVGTDSGACKIQGLINVGDISDANLTSQDISSISYNSESYLLGSANEAVTYSPAINLREEIAKIHPLTLGWSGSFTNGDGDTVTIVDGIITSVV